MAKEGEGLIANEEESKRIDQQRKPIECKITITPDNDLKIECSMLNDQFFMFGLLETARLAIIQHNMMIRQSKIIKPKTRIFGAFGKGN